MMIEHDGDRDRSRHESRVRVPPNAIAAAQVVRRCRGHIGARLDAGTFQLLIGWRTRLVRLFWQGESRHNFITVTYVPESGSVVYFFVGDRMASRGSPSRAVVAAPRLRSIGLQHPDRCAALSIVRRKLRDGNRKARIANFATLASVAVGVACCATHGTRCVVRVYRTPRQSFSWRADCGGTGRWHRRRPCSAMRATASATRSTMPEYGIDLEDENASEVHADLDAFEAARWWCAPLKLVARLLRGPTVPAARSGGWVSGRSGRSAAVSRGVRGR